MIDGQQAVRAYAARCKARGEDPFQAGEALFREFPDVSIDVIEEVIAGEYGSLSPEEWARILAIKVPPEDAAVRLRARFPDLTAARMASALKGAYTRPPLTPQRLAVALAAAHYTPLETAPAVRQEFSDVPRFEMLLLLHAAYPQIDREAVRAAMTAANYSRDPEWITLDRLNTGMSRFALGVINDQVYAIGGQHNVPRDLNQCFSLEQRAWHYCAPMPTARRQLCVGTIKDKLYAVAGTDGAGGDVGLAVNEEYDPQTDTWTRKAPPPKPTLSAAAAVVNGKLYVIGGYSVQDFPPQVFEYDPAADSWTPKAFLSIPPCPCAAAGVINGRIHVLSGWPDGMAPIMHTVYDPATDTCETNWEPPIEDSERTNFAAGVVDGKLYVLGGQRYIREDPWKPGKRVDLDTCFVYDPATNAWSQTLSLPEPRSDVAAVAIAELGLLFVVGGRADTLVLMVG